MRPSTLKPDKVDFDQFASDYDRLLADSTSFFSPSEAYFARYKADVAKRLLGDSARSIYEFGCGIGRNLRFLAEAFPGAALFASDISGESVAVARRENPGITIWTDGVDAAPDRIFDFVFVAGVYHHVSPAERSFVSRSLYELIQPGGNLLVFEHNPFNPVTRRIVSTCPYDADAVLLRPAELRGHLTAAGMDVVKSGYALFVPPRLKAFTRLERCLGWLPLGGQYWLWAKRPINE